MKKLFKIVCVIALVFSATLVSAQGRYTKGDVLLNAGVGLGYYYAGGVPLLVSAEFPVSEYITVGPYLGYTSYTYNWGWGSGYRFKYTFLDIGARGSYHFNDVFGITDEKFDVYGGLSLGYVISSYSGDDFGGTYSDPYGGALRLGLHAGARYFFSENIAGYGELGYGIAPLSLGLTFKL